jgi:hypothetical protein
MVYYWLFIYFLPILPPIYLANYLPIITYLLPTHPPTYYSPTYVPTYIFSSLYHLLIYPLLNANLACH